MTDVNCPSFYSHCSNIIFDEVSSIILYFASAKKIQFNSVLNNYSRLLDLILANIECFVDRCVYPLINTEEIHPQLEIKIPYCVPTTKPINIISLNKFNSNKCDKNQLYYELVSVDWSSFNPLEVLDGLCDIFMINSMIYFKKQFRN